MGKENGKKKKENVREREGGSEGVQARAGEEGAKYPCSPFMTERFKLAASVGPHEEQVKQPKKKKLKTGGAQVAPRGAENKKSQAQNRMLLSEPHTASKEAFKRAARDSGDEDQGDWSGDRMQAFFSTLKQQVGQGGNSAHHTSFHKAAAGSQGRGGKDGRKVGSGGGGGGGGFISASPIHLAKGTNRITGQHGGKQQGEKQSGKHTKEERRRQTAGQREGEPQNGSEFGKGKKEQEKAPKRKWSAAELQHPFEADYNDHFETSLEAYSDIAPLLELFAAKLGKTRETLRIYDPYFCAGSMVQHLDTLGFREVHNTNADCYQVWSKKATPEYDILLTNPPFSGDHKDRCLKQCVAMKRAWMVLLPSYCATKSYMSAAVQEVGGGVFFAVPTRPYDFQHPEALARHRAHFFRCGSCHLANTRRRFMRHTKAAHTKAAARCASQSHSMI